MPKGTPQLPKRLDFWAGVEMRIQIITLSYLKGQRGGHSQICRELLARALKLEMEELTPEQKKEYDFIFSRVALAETGEAQRKLKF